MPVMEPTPADITLQGITYRSEDGRQFDGFEITSDRTSFEGQETGVVFLHGLRGFALGAGISPIAHPLAREGIRCLTINKRNSGKLYETSDFEEIEHDIRGAVEWLLDRGCENIVLWGRSLAATEVAYYQGKRNDGDVNAIVLAAPFADIRERSTKSYFEAIADNPEEAYTRFVNEARQLIEEGRGSEIVSLPRPVGDEIEYIPMSAESFLSYRSPESACATIDWIPDVRTPVLLLPHAADRNVTSDEAEEIADAADAASHVEVHPIEADHFFTDAERKVAGVTADFIRASRE